MDNLADRLKSCREEAGLTQGELAKKAHVKNQSIIGSLESGYRKKSAYIPAIANVLKVDPLWLATGKGDKYGSISKAEKILREMGINADEVMMEDIEYFREAMSVPKEKRDKAKKIIHILGEDDGKKEETK